MADEGGGMIIIIARPDVSSVASRTVQAGLAGFTAAFSDALSARGVICASLPVTDDLQQMIDHVIELAAASTG